MSNKIIFTLKSYDRILLKNTLSDISQQANILKLNYRNIFSIPTKKKLFTVLRSPHIDKKSREQFQFQEHKSGFELIVDSKTIKKTFLFFFNFVLKKKNGMNLYISYTN